MMNRKMISIGMTVIMACYPIGHLRAADSFEVKSFKESEEKFYIGPDRKEIELKIDSKYVRINGKQYLLNSAPVIIEERLYVPFRLMTDHVFDIKGESDPKSKSVTLMRYGLSIRLTEGINSAVINGKEVAIDAVPLIKEGSFLVPFKLISEAFNLPFTRDALSNTIKFVVEENPNWVVEGNRPIAQFDFEKDTYIAGEAIKVIEQSFAEDQAPIIERQWQINEDKENRVSDLGEFLKKPVAGTYYISLRVKDSKQNWSQWATKTLNIKANQAPIISKLQFSKTSYAQGEELDIKYAYENEEWEEIVEELWSYRLLDEKKDQSKSTEGKPRAFFYPGKFAVSLQLKDAYGNISEKKEEIITITDKIVQTELDYKFNKGIIGSVIDNYQHFNYQNYSLVDNYTVTNTGAKLLMSNSPETVMDKGILYKDSVQGAGRVLYHHKNMFANQTENKRLVIIMENKNEFPMTVTKRRQGTRGPAGDILYTGAQVLQDFLDKDFYQDQVLLPGEKKYLFDSGTRRWNRGDTVSGLIEFYSNEEVHITVAMIGESNQIDDVDMLPILEKDGVHTRGSFENADRYYNLTLDNDQPYKLMLGLPANDMEDWLEGYDALTGEKVLNKGNYGMMYWLRLNVKEDTGVLFNVRSNIYKGAIAYTGDKAYAMPQNAFAPGTRQAFVAGVVKKDKRSELTYVLPNGSAAPVLFCFIPKSQWNQ